MKNAANEPLLYLRRLYVTRQSQISNCPCVLSESFPKVIVAQSCTEPTTFRTSSHSQSGTELTRVMSPSHNSATFISQTHDTLYPDQVCKDRYSPLWGLPHCSMETLPPRT